MIDFHWFSDHCLHYLMLCRGLGLLLKSSFNINCTNNSSLKMNQITTPVLRYFICFSFVLQFFSLFSFLLIFPWSFPCIYFLCTTLPIIHLSLIIFTFAVLGSYLPLLLVSKPSPGHDFCFHYLCGRHFQMQKVPRHMFASQPLHVFSLLKNDGNNL